MPAATACVRKRVVALCIERKEQSEPFFTAEGAGEPDGRAGSLFDPLEPPAPLLRPFSTSLSSLSAGPRVVPAAAACCCCWRCRSVALFLRWLITMAAIAPPMRMTATTATMMPRARFETPGIKLVVSPSSVVSSMLLPSASEELEGSRADKPELVADLLVLAAFPAPAPDEVALDEATVRLVGRASPSDLLADFDELGSPVARASPRSFVTVGLRSKYRSGCGLVRREVNQQHTRLRHLDQ